MSRHQLFDLAERSAFGDLEPLVLFFGHSHAGELAHSGPADGAIPQRLVELRQELECFGHAQPLGRPAGPIAKESFHILRERTEAEHDMRSGSKCKEECFPLLPIKSRAALGEFK